MKHIAEKTINELIPHRVDMGTTVAMIVRKPNDEFVYCELVVPEEYERDERFDLIDGNLRGLSKAIFRKVFDKRSHTSVQLLPKPTDSADLCL